MVSVVSERLLTVKTAFPVRGGVELLPAVSSDRLPRSPFDVTVRLPDGSQHRRSATATVAHIRGALPPLAMLRVLGESADAFPPGTEVWLGEVPSNDGGGAAV